jgi:copper chaperone
MNETFAATSERRIHDDRPGQHALAGLVTSSSLSPAHPHQRLPSREDTAVIISSYIVTGMTCAHCATSVTEEISGLAGVRDVAVDLPTGIVDVISATPIEPSDVRAAVNRAGYQLGD